VTASTGTHHEHNRAEDLLEGYLLGTLPAEDAAWMDSHVRECPRCAEEIAPLLPAVQALPFSAPVPDVAMSEDLWNRIEHAVSASSRTDTEPQFIPLPNNASVPRGDGAPHRWSTRQYIALAAVALISLLGGTILGQVMPRFLGDKAPAEQVIAIEFTDPDVAASGELRYLPDEQVFVLQVTGLPELPEGQVYQAWLIDGSGPVPVGVMGSDAGELATTGNREAFQTFAITVEQGPLGNSQPTSEPIMVASLQDPT
jgi:anti-sigma-K factor RskA